MKEIAIGIDPGTNVTAMCSSGLRAINFQHTTNDRTRYKTSNYRRNRYCL